LLPADGASDQREVVELRKELEQAQQLGEAYARELATMIAAGEMPSEPPPRPLTPSGERFETLACAAGALSRPLQWLIEGFRSDTAELTEALGDGHPAVQSLVQRASRGAELLFEIERVAQCSELDAPTRFDVSEVIRELGSAFEGRAARHGVELSVQAKEPIQVRHPRNLVALLIRSLIDNAIQATPRGSEVLVRLRPSRSGGARLTVEDGGPVIPAAHRTDLIRRRVDPSSLGRPNGLSLLVADAAAALLGVELGLGESERGRFQAQARL
jgi:signal transduction histidine kinase